MKHNLGAPLTWAIVAGAVLWNPGAYALEFDAGVGTGLQYTSNARRAADDGDQDLISVGYLGASLSEDSGRVQANATSMLNYGHYFNNSFSDQVDYDLAATAAWEMVRDRLNWQVQEFFSQTLVDSLETNTPSNRQDTNAFTIGPTIFFPVSGRQRFTLSPQYRDFYFADSDADNRQYVVNLGWQYQLNPTTELGLNGGVNRTDFKDSGVPDFTMTSLGVMASRTGPSTQTSLNLGVANFQREQFDDTRGFTARLAWLYDLTGRSSVRLHLSSDLTNPSNDFVDSQVTPSAGNFSNEQVSSDVLRNNTARITYTRDDARFNSAIYAEYRSLDYEVSDLDREVQAIGTRISHPLSPSVRAGLNGRFNHSKETDTDRENNRYTIGGDLRYRLSRSLHTTFSLGYRREDSTRSDSEFNEVRAFVTLVYGFGEVEQPNSGGRIN